MRQCPSQGACPPHQGFKKSSCEDPKSCIASPFDLRSQHFCRPIRRPEIMIDQPFSESEASPLRRDVKTLHLATALRLDVPESDTTHRNAGGIAGKQQFTSRGSEAEMEAMPGKYAKS
jgi:hypothetical protein